jgi:hypothetical protein
MRQTEMPPGFAPGGILLYAHRIFVCLSKLASFNKSCHESARRKRRLQLVWQAGLHSSIKN